MALDYIATCWFNVGSGQLWFIWCYRDSALVKLGVVWLVLVSGLVLAHMCFSRGSSWVKHNMHECCTL